MPLETIRPYLNFFHPLFMWTLFGLTIYAMYLGLQSRRLRLADKEIKKKLAKGKFGSRHHKIGSAVLALMVMGNLEGMAVTYINNDKLFIGPHLLAGLGMTALITLATALVPLMQKKNETARLAHIGLNVVVVGLFGWQAITGMQIVQRILENF